MERMKCIKTMLCIVIFYCTSLAMSFFSAFLLSKDKYNFNFPLLITGSHNLIHFVISAALLRLIYKSRTPEGALAARSSCSGVSETETETATGKEVGGRKMNLLARIVALSPEISMLNGGAVACALAGSIDTGLSNYSLRFVPLAFYTMLKSCTPIFILLSGFMFKLEKPSLKLFLIILIIAFGVFLTSKSDTPFDKRGASLIISASLMAGFRWAFVEYFLKGERVSDKSNVLRNVRTLSFPMSIFLLLAFLFVEGPRELGRSVFFSSPTLALKSMAMIFAGGVLSFFLSFTEYLLVSRTNVITLSVSGIVKELLIIAISIHSGRVHLAAVNYYGLAVTTIGIFLFTFRNLLFVDEPEIPEELAAPKGEEANREQTAIPVHNVHAGDQALRTPADPASVLLVGK